MSKSQCKKCGGEANFPLDTCDDCLSKEAESTMAGKREQGIADYDRREREMYQVAKALMSERGIPEAEDFVRFWDEDSVQLDGTFSLEQLRVIIDVMEAEVAKMRNPHETVEMLDPDTGKTFVAAVPVRTYPLRRRAEDGGEDWVSYDGGKTWGRPVKP